jgi:hypothetical protein
MPTYLVARHIPGIGKLSADELRALCKQSIGVLGELAPDIAWHHSYVAGDRMFCVYDAVDPSPIRAHAHCMGIPADEIIEIDATISPSTARPAQ